MDPFSDNSDEENEFSDREELWISISSGTLLFGSVLGAAWMWIVVIDTYEAALRAFEMLQP